MSDSRTENMRSDTFRQNNQQIWAAKSKDIEIHILQMLVEGKSLLQIYDYAIKERRRLAFALGQGHGFGKIRKSHFNEGGDTISKDSEGPYATSFSKMLDILLEQPDVPRTNETPVREAGIEGVPDTALLVHLVNFSNDFSDKDNISIQLSYGEMNRKIYKQALNQLNTLVQEIKDDHCQGDEMLLKLGLLAYDLSRLWPLERGSAGVNHWILRSIAAYKGVNLGVLKVRELPFDICAMVQTDRQAYAKDFLACVNKQLEQQSGETLPSEKEKGILDLYFQSRKDPEKPIDINQLAGLTLNINDLYLASKLLPAKPWDEYLGLLKNNNFFKNHIQSTRDLSTLLRSLPDDAQTPLITHLLDDEEIMKLIKSPEKMTKMMKILHPNACEVFWKEAGHLLSKFIAREKVSLFDITEMSTLLPTKDSKQDFLIILNKSVFNLFLKSGHHLENIVNIYKNLDADFFSIFQDPAVLLPLVENTYDLVGMFKLMPEKTMRGFLLLLDDDKLKTLLPKKESLRIVYDQLKKDNGKINVFLNYLIEKNEFSGLHTQCNVLLKRANKSDNPHQTHSIFQQNRDKKEDPKTALSQEKEVPHEILPKGPGQ